MAAETPEPTLDDLLTACDVAEDAGVPPKVVETLREMVRRHSEIEQKAIDNGISIELGNLIARQLTPMQRAFFPGGSCHGLMSPGDDLIDDGIPALIAEVERLREGLHRGRDYVAALEEMVRRRDVALWEQCGVTIAEPSPPARPDVFDPLPPIRLRDTPARRDHAPNHV
jgi:hypothetical protein